MSQTSTPLTMPAARDFGWALKPTSSSHFAIHQRDNGQFCVVLNHALLRGVSAEMIAWWFRHFAAGMRVRLPDTPGYEGRDVAPYLLWHPVDHYDATLSGRLAPDGTARAGAWIHIQEAMQYDVYGWDFPVDTKVKLFYVGPDGWAMGKTLPVLGPVMVLRIHFRDVVRDGRRAGVHYHYEVVIGASGRGPLARFVNSKITKAYGPDFFSAWRRHNVIEVGTFENFLAPLYAQREDLAALEYRLAMNPAPADPSGQTGHDRALFDARLEGYKASANPFAHQAYDRASFL